MRRYVIISLLCLLGFTGCHGPRSGKPEKLPVSDTVKVMTDTVSVPLVIHSPATYVPPVRQWLSVRMSGNVKVPGMGGLDLNLFAVLLKDSLVYLHISKFGIELGRALCSPEKMLLLVHPELAYWEGDYAAFRKKSGVPLDFGTLQDLLLLTPRNVNDVVDSAGYLIRVRWLDQGGVCYLQAKYGTYSDIAADSQVRYPQQIMISMPRSGGTAYMSVKSVKVEVPGPVSVRIPSKYKPLQW